MQTINAGQSQTFWVDAGNSLGISITGNSSGTYTVLRGTSVESQGQLNHGSRLGPFTGPRAVSISCVTGAVQVDNGPEAATNRQPISKGIRLAFYGSSTMARHWDVTNARLNASAKGHNTWGIARRRKTIPITVVGNFGVAGETNDQIAARVGDVIASDANMVCFHAGTNDVFQSARTGKVAFELIEPALLKLLAAGIRVRIDLPQKWNSSDPTYNATTRAEYYDYLERLTRFARSHANVSVVNLAGVVVDPASADANQRTNYFDGDTKHLSNLGAYQAGKLVAEDFDAIPIEPGNVVRTENLLPNPMMTTTKAATAPVTGTEWDNATTARAVGSATVACSVVPAPAATDPKGPWATVTGMCLRIQVSNAANNDRVNWQIPSSIILPKVKVGQNVRFGLTLRIASSTALRAITAYLFRNSNQLAITDMGRDTVVTTNDKALPDEVIELRLETPVWKVLAGTTQLDAFFAFLFNGAGAADIYIAEPSLEVVDAEPAVVS